MPAAPIVSRRVWPGRTARVARVSPPRPPDAPALGGFGATYPAALPPSAPKRSTVTALTPSGTVKVSVPVAV